MDFKFFFDQLILDIKKPLWSGFFIHDVLWSIVVFGGDLLISEVSITASENFLSTFCSQWSISITKKHKDGLYVCATLFKLIGWGFWSHPWEWLHQPAFYPTLMFLVWLNSTLKSSDLLISVCNHDYLVWCQGHTNWWLFSTCRETKMTNTFRLMLFLVVFAVVKHGSFNVGDINIHIDSSNKSENVVHEYIK